MLDVWMVDQGEANLQPSCVVMSSWCCPQLSMQQMEIYWSWQLKKTDHQKGPCNQADYLLFTLIIMWFPTPRLLTEAN